MDTSQKLPIRFGETIKKYIARGLDLYEAGLGERIEGMVKELFAGNGAVRKTLHQYVAAR